MPGTAPMLTLRAEKESRWKTAGLLLISGAALGLSFPPFPFPFLAWIALAPLLMRWRQARSGRLFLLEAYTAFLVTFAVAFHWPLLHVLPRTALLSLGGVLFLPLLMALPWAAAAAVRRRRGLRPGLLALVAFYLVMEWGLSRGPMAFPWPLLGHTQAEALAFNQFAEYTGVPGLSLWVLLLNILFFLLLAERPGRGRSTVLLIALIALPLAYGVWRRTHLPPSEWTLPLAFVQPTVEAAAWADVHDTARVGRLLHLSDSLLEAAPRTPALVLWPETALPVLDSVEQVALYGTLQAWADRRGAALLTGAITRAEDASRANFFNTALLFRPGDPLTRYDKRRLVPFAERVPFVERAAWLEALAVPAGGVAGYRPGPRQTVLQIDGAAFGVLICFESAFGDYARRYVGQGADFLVTLAQDGWWGRSLGYRQHLAFTRLRAVEARRAMAFVTVTGTTALILPDGATAFEIGWMKEEARLADLPLHTGATFYSRHGDWLSHLALGLALLLGGWLLLSSRESGRTITKGIDEPKNR